MQKTDKDNWYPNISNVVSASECTGLIQTPPLDDEEFSSYQELSDMEIPKEETEKKQ